MRKKESGKRYGQKYKSFLVAQLLLKYTDENNALSVAEIIEHLNDYDIEAEHHSIVRDVKDLEELLKLEELLNFYINTVVELVIEENAEFVKNNKDLVKNIFINVDEFVKKVNANMNEEYFQ